MTWNPNKQERYASYRKEIASYVERVVSGTEGAGELERLAVERYVRDINNEDADFYFYESAALRAIDFAPALCRHSIGRFAAQRFYLEPWQQFVIANLFGFKNKESGYRRFTDALISVARKNGKSTLSAFIALYMLVADAEASAEIYFGAPTQRQAMIVYRATRQMIEANECLRRKIKINQYELRYKPTDSFVKAISSERRISGLNPSLVILDELHELQANSRDMYEKLTTGSGARTQPLTLRITTEGDENSCIYNQERDKGVLLLRSASSSLEHYFFAIYSPSEKVDVEDETQWRAANPNLGVSITKEYLRKQCEEAQTNNAQLAAFRRYHLNSFTKNAVRFITPEVWAKGAKDTKIEKGMPCFVGLDMARSIDMASVSAVFPIVDEYGDETFHIICKCYTVENRHPKLKEQIDRWVKSELVTELPGEVIHFKTVLNQIIEWSESYNIVNVAFDPMFCEGFAQNLEEEYGIPVYKFAQNPRMYTPPLQNFLLALMDGKVFHNNDPVLSWCFSNLNIKRFPNGALAPIKNAGSEFKIDGAVSTLMAFAGTCRGEGCDPKANDELALYFIE